MSSPLFLTLSQLNYFLLIYPALLVIGIFVGIKQAIKQSDNNEQD